MKHADELRPDYTGDRAHDLLLALEIIDSAVPKAFAACGYIRNGAPTGKAKAAQAQISADVLETAIFLSHTAASNLSKLFDLLRTIEPPKAA